jgi:hypothetical protein
MTLLRTIVRGNRKRCTSFKVRLSIAIIASGMSQSSHKTDPQDPFPYILSKSDLLSMLILNLSSAM